MDDIDWERRHGYLSTACAHGLHDRCRLRCKFCAEPCLCLCHRLVIDGDPSPPPGSDGA